ncbi:unnamed protein product [Tetraodon nigroviridis]|uniref:(spotted green pufferfish) hypothetical protein n=1 Tax=Tetraodon nigroviridis TaxID=99883 RepID=Q4S8C1_TETNG|nr:unnamed protein product [Tetraodon nigroviridis]
MIQKDYAYVVSQMKVSGEAWVLANLHISGYYRVNYDPTNWERLISLLGSNHMAIPVINRAQIIDDAFNLARAKMINITLALRTTKYLSRERDFIPWESALRNLDYFTLMLDRTEVYEALQASTASLGARRPAGNGLPEETNPTVVRALQDHHSQLDQDSRKTHGSVQPDQRHYDRLFCGGGELQGVDQELVQKVDGEPRFQPVSAAQVGPSAVGRSALTAALLPGQDPSQPEEQRLLQRHSQRRRGGVELCLEHVQERHPGLGGLAAERSPGLHPATLAAQQVCSSCPRMADRLQVLAAMCVIPMDQVPEVLPGPHQDPQAGQHLHHPERGCQCGRNATGLELHQGKLGSHFPAVRACSDTHTHTHTHTHVRATVCPPDCSRHTFVFFSCRFGKESFVLSRLVSRVTSRFSTEFELQELKRFHQEKSHTGFGSATLAMEQALEKTAANIKWVKENRAQVLRWLQEETA